MAWRIEFTGRARQQLSKVDRVAARRITDFLINRLAGMNDPRTVGIVLQHGSGSRFWRYRVGNYRIIARIEDDLLRILVIRVAHRREAYRRLRST